MFKVRVCFVQLEPDNQDSEWISPKADNLRPLFPRFITMNFMASH